LERLARTLLRSTPVERTGRAELRGRCSLAAGRCAQRYWLSRPLSLSIDAAEPRAAPNATRGDGRRLLRTAVLGHLAFLAQRAPTEGENGGAVNQLSAIFPRAREARHLPHRPPQQRKTRRLLTNRPCFGFAYEEPHPKERLRVSNRIVQRLYHYAVNETVEF
jgi:hypothetical protein